MRSLDGIRFATCPDLVDGALNDLFRSAWPGHRDRDFATALVRSLGYVCAFSGDQLVGFVNVAWDGYAHAFLLDPTVDPRYRRRGIGTELIQRAAALSRERGVEWLHVDYEPNLLEFYRLCGFGSTSAGIMRLGTGAPDP